MLAASGRIGCPAGGSGQENLSTLFYLIKEKTMSDIRQRENELNQMILGGQALEAFEKFYAEDLVMQENNEPPRVGKAANRKFEEDFFGSIAEFHGATLGDVAVDGDLSFSEWTFDVTFKDGARVANPQVTRRKWRDGLVVHERFYHA
jgi:ketosteroid isomerase-like protein